MLERLLEARDNWVNKVGKFMFNLPIMKHEQYRYLPSYYRTLAWYENQIANAYEDLEDTTFPVEVKKIDKKNYY
mgnify:CR=1 FL=1